MSGVVDVVVEGEGARGMVTVWLAGADVVWAALT